MPAECRLTAQEQGLLGDPSLGSADKPQTFTDGSWVTIPPSPEGPPSAWSRTRLKAAPTPVGFQTLGLVPLAGMYAEHAQL